eukprot:TRINITY_DN51768_c0_g1_i2.p2 TRINITY_DN51768_c0_g1~~TRINITY_DN51768_c0_g1_i2.p2  ORF type:complete len:152 (-),score=34.50 TRINITY_DN51768_c0_g1_i2:3-458(-)
MAGSNARTCRMDDSNQGGRGEDFFGSTFSVASQATVNSSTGASVGQHSSPAASEEDERHFADLPPLVESGDAWWRDAVEDCGVSATGSHQLGEQHLTATLPELRGIPAMLQAVHFAPRPDVRSDALVVAMVLELRDLAALLEQLRRELAGM